MYKLQRADYPGNFHGFTLKEGYYYGIDTETGRYIATSGWECAGNVALYFLEDGKWVMHWIDVESKFQIENIPQIYTDDKMTFVEWLEKFQGIEPEEWDENYSGEIERQIEEEYEIYLYDGLPRFVIKNIKKEEINMKTFKTLAEVAEYIRDGEDTSGYRWNNGGGDWDIDDIFYNTAMYDQQYSEYTVDVETYDIYDADYKSGECLFRRVEDVEDTE